jgi:hypothetical protein
MHRAGAVTLAVCLLASLALLPLATATVDSDTTHVDIADAAATLQQENATVTADTSVATDRSISGFTVGAAVIAVLVGGSVWYFRH